MTTYSMPDPLDEMPVGEVGAELPGQAKREDPDRGEPHPGVVVEISCLQQLLHPVIEAVDPGLALDGATVGARKAALSCRRKLLIAIAAVSPPDLRPRLQMALEVAAPEDLMHELLRDAQGMLLQDPIEHLALGDEAVADVRREN